MHQECFLFVTRLIVRKIYFAELFPAYFQEKELLVKEFDFVFGILFTICYEVQRVAVRLSFLISHWQYVSNFIVDILEHDYEIKNDF